MSTLLPLIVTILVSCHSASAVSCYTDGWGYRHCNYLPTGARIGIAIGLLVLGFFLLALLFFHRRRRLANRNAILLHQQQQQPNRAQWGGLNGQPQYNAGTPYGQNYGGQPYGQQQPYAQPFNGGFQYPANNTGYPNQQQQSYQPGYTNVYTATTPAMNTKAFEGYDVSNDKSANVQPPQPAYDPSQPHIASGTNPNPNANNPVESSNPPEYSGYQPPGGAPPQMPTGTGSQNPEGHGSNNPYVYNPPSQGKS